MKQNRPCAVFVAVLLALGMGASLSWAEEAGDALPAESTVNAAAVTTNSADAGDAVETAQTEKGAPSFEKPSDAQLQSPVELNGDLIEYKAEEAKFIASGNVYLKQNDAVLYCDKLEFYRDKKEAHATGNVILESPQGTIWADRGFYNFDTRRGEFTRARIMAAPMFGYATNITKVNDTYYLLSDGWLSTSDYDDPESRMKARKIEVYPNDKAVVHNATLLVGGIPVMYMPRYTQRLTKDNVHFRVTPGYKKDFGFYLLSQVRMNPFEKIETTYHFDYRELKYLAGGVDVKYEPTAVGEGLVKTYYMDERTTGVKRIWDTRSQPAMVRERYRVEWRHQWAIDDTTSAIAQYYKLSDPDILKTYFEKEYRADQAPTTYAVLTKNLPRATASIRTDVKVNRFDGSVQRLPEVNFTLNNQPVGDTGFYIKSSNTVSSLLHKETAPNDARHHTVRADTDNELSRPFKLKFLELRPFVGTEQTYYTRALDPKDNDAVRGIFRTGMDVSTKFYRLYDVNFKRYGIEVNRLRHVITPTMAYLYQHRPTMPSEKFFSYDSTDSKSEIDQVQLALGNTLQTKRKGKSVDLFHSLLSAPYYFNDKPSGRPGRLGDIKLENEAYPNQYVTFHQDATFDNQRHVVETVNLDLYLKDGKRWEFDIGRRYTRDDDDLLTTQLKYIINPKWRATLYDQWNLKTGVWKEQEYSLVRDLHSWEVEFAVKEKKGYQSNGTEFWFVFRLKAFPTLGFGGSSTFNRSRQGAQQGAAE